MSQPQLVTIDFFGIASHQNEISQMLSSAMDSHQKPLYNRSTQSCLGKITPHMLQQVLSNVSLSDSENFQTRVCEGMRTLDLFPQHPLGFQCNDQQEKSQSDWLDPRIENSEAVPNDSQQIVPDSGESNEIVDRSNFNLPMAKKLSLQRFLQKRKERLSRVNPYATSSK